VSGSKTHPAFTYHIDLSGRRGDGKSTVVDEETYYKYGRLKWFLSDTGYAMRRSETLGDGRRITQRLHRLVVDAPMGLVVDHLNGDRLDNRKRNLRICTQKDNANNRKHTAVPWDKD
jgi:hypothetical protein